MSLLHGQRDILYNYKFINLRWCGTLGGHTIIFKWLKNQE
jgi:hypothetical protein